MTESEINESVARKLGWTYEKPPEVSLDMPMPWIRPNGSRTFVCPDFCNDINAAWEIVELYRMTLTPGEAGWWAGHEMGVPKLYEHADSAPMAICLAFLKL